MDETYAGENLLCPIRYALDVAGGKRELPIIRMLAGGLPTRYGSIKRKLTGVTNIMPAQSLKELEAAGIVHRELLYQKPPEKCFRRNSPEGFIAYHPDEFID